MAYTYDDFVAAANNAGLLNMFSESDLNTAKTNPEYGLSMLKLQQDIGAATTAEQKLLAEEAANQLRKSYGMMTTPATGSSFTYKGQDAYDQLLKDITNYKPFAYNPETDPRMAAYRKTYLREAERARADTMAKASAATGGVPSSYAVGAAEQAGNYYTGKINDVIPELFSDAYSQHMNDFNLKVNALGAMDADRQFDYSAFLGGLEQKQQQWNNAMAMYQLFGYEAPQEYLDILGIQKPVVHSGGGGGDFGGSGGSEKDSSSESGSGEPTLDMNSVLNLGKGPVSESTLADMVANGSVTATQVGNKIVVSNNNPSTSNKVFGSLSGAYKLFQKIRSEAHL